MKIAVCIKRVPDMDVRFAIGAGGKALDPAGLKFDIADFDGYAVEAALQLKEKQPARARSSSCLVGPDAVQETLRKALSMGADRAIQLKADEVPFDGLADRHGARRRAQGRRLRPDPLRADGHRQRQPDRRPDDRRAARAALRHARSRSSTSPPAAARASASSRAPSETVEFPLPAVVTIDEGLARPRLPSLKGIMAAKKKPLEVEAGAAGRGAPHRAVDGAAARAAAGRIIGEGADAVPELIRLLQTEAKVL